MRLLPLATAALLLIGVTGCSDAGTDTPAAPGGSAPPSDQSAGDCGGLTTDDLSGIFGVELQGPETSRGDGDDNGVSWTSTGCDWENDAEGFEVDLDIAEASDFADGEVICVEPDDRDVAPVDGIGTDAWWEFDDSGDEGELRVCTDDMLVELSVDTEDASATSDDLRDKAVEAVRVVVG